MYIGIIPALPDFVQQNQGFRAIRPIHIKASGRSEPFGGFSYIGFSIVCSCYVRYLMNSVFTGSIINTNYFIMTDQSK